MERRLIKVIMNPAMMVSWAVGLWLAWSGFAFLGVWLWIKIAAVIGLTVFHVFLSRAARRFASVDRIR
jgi:putative membrane protein